MSDNEENGSVFRKHFSSQFTKTTLGKPKGDATIEREGGRGLYPSKELKKTAAFSEFYKHLYLINCFF